eukprot:TRINITY_DN3167_c0_g4_i1.p1 TRINITY_DN3167_c0_g4~~TRINITY_DN3167_c0_g4_i1.p1  ORF type:complete len:566 (+),score=58.35 TRINITY_DN3167_c0_g4_i1:1734-3431(+)
MASMALSSVKNPFQAIELGKPGSLAYRIFFTDNCSPAVLSPLNDIPLCTPHGGFSCICTTPVGSWVQYIIAHSEPAHPVRIAEHIEDPRSAGRNQDGTSRVRRAISSLPTSPRNRKNSIDSHSWRTANREDSIFQQYKKEKENRRNSNPSFYSSQPLLYSECVENRMCPLPPTYSPTVTDSRENSFDEMLSPTYDYSCSPFASCVAHSICPGGGFSVAPVPEVPVKKHTVPTHYSENARWNLGFFAQTSMLPPPQEDGQVSDGKLATTTIKADIRPLNVIDVSFHKTRRPGEVYGVKPLASLCTATDPSASKSSTTKMDSAQTTVQSGTTASTGPFGGTASDGSEVEWTVVVIALDDPMAELLEDGEDLEAHLPGTLVQVQAWLEAQRRSDDAWNDTCLSIDTHLASATAMICQTYDHWCVQTEGNPPHTPLPLVRDITQHWEEMTRDVSTATIPVSSPALESGILFDNAWFNRLPSFHRASSNHNLQAVDRGVKEGKNESQGAKGGEPVVKPKMTSTSSKQVAESSKRASQPKRKHARAPSRPGLGQLKRNLMHLLNSRRVQQL